MKTIGDRIKEARTNKNLTLEELGELLGLSHATLSKYENSKIDNIPSDRIEQIAKILEVTPSFLMGWEELSQEEEIINRLIQKTESKEISWKKDSEIVKDFEEDPSRFHYQRAVSALRNDETLNSIPILNTIKITQSILGHYVLFKDKEDIVYLYHLKEVFDQEKLNYLEIYISDSSKINKLNELYDFVMLETQPNNRTTILNELLKGLE